MNHETFRELLPLYVIGALDGAELQELERYIAANRTRCAEEIAAFQAVADLLPLSAPPATPSPEVFERIRNAIGEAEKPAPRRREEPAFDWNRIFLGWIPWTATALACVVIVMMLGQLRALNDRYHQQMAAATAQKTAMAELRATLEREVATVKAANEKLQGEKAELLQAADQLRQRVTRQDLQVAALEKQVGQQSASLDLVMDPAVRVSQMTDPSGATKGAAKVYWHDTKKTGLVVVSNLQAVIKGQGKDLELWAFCGDKPPVPAGLFWTDATGHGVAEIKLVKELACVSKFAVTIEPAGGVQVATGPVVLLGP